MDFLHYELDLAGGDVVEVTFDHAANVQLMDSSNYENYRNGRPFHYFGGYARTSPVRIGAPRSGHWHVAIDLGGAAGTVRASVRTIPSAAPASA